MKPKKTGASAEAVKARNAKPKKKQLPPDPDGMFKRAAARGKKVIAMYDDLNPGLHRKGLVDNLLFDLMHFSDRDPSLGDSEKNYWGAVGDYERFVEENELFVLAHGGSS
jgi:hypothetical protein